MQHHEVLYEITTFGGKKGEKKSNEREIFPLWKTWCDGFLNDQEHMIEQNTMHLSLFFKFS